MSSTPDKEKLLAASQPMLARASADFRGLARSHTFNLLLGVLGALGAGLGALAPSDASGGRRFLTAVAAALGALALSYLLAFLWSLLRTPFRQRSELIALVTPTHGAPKPILTTEVAVDVRAETRASQDLDRFGNPRAIGDRRHVAFIRVYNAQELGGEEATARHVTPEVKIFDAADSLVFHGKGWDVTAWRDFTTSQEEHALWIAAKWEGASGFAAIKQQSAQPVQLLPDGTYRVEVALRGFLPEGPVTRDFTLSSEGEDSPLVLKRDETPREERSAPRLKSRG